MKIFRTTETGRHATGYPVEISTLGFEVGETPGAAGDFVSLRIFDEDDPNGHHAIELSFGEVAEIEAFAGSLREKMRAAIKAMASTKRKTAKAATEPEHEVEQTNGTGEPEPEDVTAAQEGEDEGELPPEPTTKRRRAARRPRGATAAAGD